MRRGLAAVVVFSLMTVATAAFGVTVGESYLDAFSSVTYSGSDGSIHWEKPWKEIGEDDGPASGSVLVEVSSICPKHRCLQITGAGEGLEELGASRAADLSAYERAEFRYQINTLLVSGGGEEGDGRLYVQVSEDMSSWETLERIDLYESSPSLGMRAFDVSESISEGFGIRFFVSGEFIGAAFIDNVEIAVQRESATTTTVPETTTTTKPNQTTTTTSKETTTTRPVETTTTMPIDTTTTVADSTTTTVADSTTTTTARALVPSVDEPPRGSGLRNPDKGLQFDHEEGLMGEMDMEKPAVLGIAIDADYSMAVELIESSWIWLVALLLVIATAIVTGIDRRRGRFLTLDR